MRTELLADKSLHQSHYGPVRLPVALFFILCLGFSFNALAQLPTERRCLPPSAGSASLQQQIEIQSRRLSSSDVEERRCAAMSLGWMNRADSSRAAVPALRDSASIVRATATRAVLSLPGDEAAAHLLPLLNDRNEFVRQETAYALGETHSRQATARLLTILEKEKMDSVRGAAVVALGLIRDETAVVPLTQILDLRVNRRKKNENEFVRRAAAVALGQIGSRAAVPALIAALADERAPNDVRREAARALGLIGDSTAIAPLRSVLASPDPYLSRIAYEALLKISPAEATRPT
ncbi:MAG: HEAT repeat domain-containing protein [Pyrinomonadaceae bacterium]|nr:HEAT repeat domain-containing protein [Pyrinomonadaceae bacterium]